RLHAPRALRPEASAVRADARRRPRDARHRLRLGAEGRDHPPPGHARFGRRRVSGLPAAARRADAGEPRRAHTSGVCTVRRTNFGDRTIGDGEPAYVVAEIGINHNGDLELARRLIDAAVDAGCDAVKFQKRTPELCVPIEQQAQFRETPWGVMSYLDYRRRIEFGVAEYTALIDYCHGRAINWFASVW